MCPECLHMKVLLRRVKNATEIIFLLDLSEKILKCYFYLKTIKIIQKQKK